MAYGTLVMVSVVMEMIVELFLAVILAVRWDSSAKAGCSSFLPHSSPRPHPHNLHYPYQQGVSWILSGIHCLFRSSSVRSGTYPGESAMGEAAAVGSGCSSAGSISSSCGMYSGYIGSGTKSSGGGDCGSSGPAYGSSGIMGGLSIPGEPMSESSSTGMDTDVWPRIRRLEDRKKKGFFQEYIFEVIGKWFQFKIRRRFFKRRFDLIIGVKGDFFEWRFVDVEFRFRVFIGGHCHEFIEFSKDFFFEDGSFDGMKDFTSFIEKSIEICF
ncbi:hypothetical protein Tco_0257572 [Tanacetum coccineum]